MSAWKSTRSAAFSKSRRCVSRHSCWDLSMRARTWARPPERRIAVAITASFDREARAGSVDKGRTRHRLDGHRRQLDSEHRPPAPPCAVCAHRAAVRRDEVSDDGKTEAETAAGLRTDPLVKAIEDVRQEVRLDAASRVAHPQQRLRGVVCKTDHDVSAGWCELD